MTIAVFDFATWAARYPELASISSVLAGAYFSEACLYLDNTDASLVKDANIRLMLLNILTAHIAKMNAAINGIPASDIVGRISNATEGSVSVGAELQLPQGIPQWYGQTRYGIAYWTAMAPYRTMRYRVGKLYNPDPYAPYIRGF
jgi:hypothetical protein